MDFRILFYYYFCPPRKILPFFPPMISLDYIYTGLTFLARSSRMLKKKKKLVLRNVINVNSAFSKPNRYRLIIPNNFFLSLSLSLSSHIHHAQTRETICYNKNTLQYEYIERSIYQPQYSYRYTYTSQRSRERANRSFQRDRARKTPYQARVEPVTRYLPGSSSDPLPHILRNLGDLLSPPADHRSIIHSQKLAARSTLTYIYIYSPLN